MLQGIGPPSKVLSFQYFSAMHGVRVAIVSMLYQYLFKFDFIAEYFCLILIKDQIQL